MKTPVLFSLSAVAIADQILALSSLRATLTKVKNDVPRVLSRDRLPAIFELTKTAFSSLTLQLLPFVTDASVNDETATEIDDSGNMLLTLSLPLPDDNSETEQGVVRRLLEHSLTMKVLSMAFSDVDNESALRFSRLANESFDAIRALLSSTDPVPARFPLCWL